MRERGLEPPCASFAASFTATATEMQRLGDLQRREEPRQGRGLVRYQEEELVHELILRLLNLREELRVGGWDARRYLIA